MKELDKYFSGELDPKIQYSSIEQGIKAFAEEYSFNIESELFNQLTKEQQALWRKEIEQSCISGGEVGVGLARDTRYKENLEVEEVDLEKIINDYFKDWKFDDELDIMVKPNNYSASFTDLKEIAKHFFELGMQVSNKAQKGEKI